MNLYDFPKFSQSKKPKRNSLKIISVVVFLSVFFGFLAGSFSSFFFYSKTKSYLEKLNFQPQLTEIGQGDSGEKYDPQTVEEMRIVKTVKDVSPAVVSIVVTKDVPILEEYYEYDFWGFAVPKYREKGIETKEVGGGTGFIVSSEGLIVTNKHVVLDKEADYTVFTNSGDKFSAKVLARDPVQDLAVLSIEQEGEEFSVVYLGDSDKLEMGQTVIAIGNALGEFRNTVSSGVVSGLGRRITASDSSGKFAETLNNVIQTDAAINKGNSGGPLLNLKGEVVGINVAVALEAQSIGFAIPINKVKRAISQAKETGEIIYPFIGIRYVLVNETVKQEKELSVDYGALIVDGGSSGPAVWPDSPAQKAGLKQGDIVLEIQGEKITQDNPLADIILKYNPGDEVVLKILRNGEELDIGIVLTKREE